MDKQEAATAPKGQYVIHLLRTTQQTHVQLSSMADQKANILIGAGLILLTFLSSQLEPGHVNLPYLALAVTTTMSGVFALLVLTPRVQTVNTEGDQFNLLFFGHFTQLTETQFQNRMARIIDEESATYRSMAKDVYQIGRVLQKKYRYLRWSYQVFLAGWLLAFVLYVYSALIA